MKSAGSTCALSGKVDSGEVARCLADRSLAISRCKIPFQDMNSCYSKLKELVPTLPADKKASKMEILQHVIDYIWDLQVELDEPGIHRRTQAANGSSLGRAPRLTTLNTERASIAVENCSSGDRIQCR